MPETRDLDRLLDDLATDVARRSVAPGAGAAVRTARRRRAATGIAAVAAVAALAVGAGSLVDLTGGEQRGIDPAAPSQGDDGAAGGSGGGGLGPVPPRALDGAAMDAATTGWAASGWRVSGSPVLVDAPCLALRGVPQPVADDATELRLGRTTGAGLVRATFADPARAGLAFTAFASSVGECGGAESVPTGDPRVQAVRVPGEGGDAARDVWVVQDGARLALLTVVGVEQAPSDEQAAAVTAAVRSALLARR